MIVCHFYVWLPGPTCRTVWAGMPGLEEDENPENQPGRVLVSPKTI